MNTTNNSTEHTVKAFDSDISEMRGLIAEIGGRAEKSISLAMKALANNDLDLAREVVKNDKQIDALEEKIDRMVIQTIALRAPMADDLRELVATLKISGVVERIGDYAKNIAKRVAVIDNDLHIEPASLLPAMAQAASQLVDDALTAYATRDADLADQVCERDRVVDDFYNTIFRSLVTHMVDNPKHIGAGAHFLFIAKNLERIGDHATNVAEMVYFAVTGENIGERERGDNPSDPLYSED